MSALSNESNPSSLSKHGLQNLNEIHWNLGPARLVEHALHRNEGQLAANGSLLVRTGQYTGRSPQDRFIVEDDLTRGSVDWGAVNRKISRSHL